MKKAFFIFLLTNCLTSSFDLRCSIKKIEKANSLLENLSSEAFSRITYFLPSTERGNMRILSKSLLPAAHNAMLKQREDAFVLSLLYGHLRGEDDYIKSELMGDIDNVKRPEVPLARNKKKFRSLFLKYVDVLQNHFGASLNRYASFYYKKKHFNHKNSGEVLIEILKENVNENINTEDIDILYAVCLDQKLICLSRMDKYLDTYLDKIIADVSLYENNRMRIAFAVKNIFDPADQCLNYSKLLAEIIKKFFEKIEKYNKEKNINLFDIIKIIDFSDFLHSMECYAENDLDCLISTIFFPQCVTHFVTPLTLVYLLKKRENCNIFVPLPQPVSRPSLSSYNCNEKILKLLCSFRCGLIFSCNKYLSNENQFTLFNELLRNTSPFIRFPSKRCPGARLDPRQYKPSFLIKALLRLLFNVHYDKNIELEYKTKSLLFSQLKYHKARAKDFQPLLIEKYIKTLQKSRKAVMDDLFAELITFMNKTLI